MHPTRLSEYNDENNHYPRELTEKDGKLYLINEDRSKTLLTPPPRLGPKR